MKSNKTLLIILLLVAPKSLATDGQFRTGERVVFLGDSVTAAGQFVTYLDLQLRIDHGKDTPELINLGLPSEGVTGLSERPHPFPRPNVHERLKRALEILKPDVVVACYGINDGIYHPFDDDRFEQFKRGTQLLIKTVKDSGARLVLCTPIAFDAQPLRSANKLLPANTDQDFSWFAIYEGYESVIAKYSDYVKTLRGQVDRLVDVHDPIKYSLIARRKTKKDYAMSDDGVHVDQSGHAVIAKSIAAACGVKWHTQNATLFSALDKRTKVLHDSYLSEVGHQRPGMSNGLPIAAAEAEAAKIATAVETQMVSLRAELAKPKGGPLGGFDANTELPNALLIGDSISIGYTLGVRQRLSGIANVYRPPTNCGPSTKGMAEIDQWIGQTNWDVIHFNFGLHDLKWLGPDGENLAEPQGADNHQQVPIGEYVRYIDAIATKLKATGATVIWRNTTPVPKGAKGRAVGDSRRYNRAAAEVMAKHGIAIDDMYGYTIDRLDKIMRPANVHFHPEGNDFLADKVAAIIKSALAKVGL